MSIDKEVIEFNSCTQSLSLYDICAEDMEIDVEKDKDNRIVISIKNEDGEEVCKDILHQYAWDSLVYFAKQVLYSDSVLTMD